MKPLHNHYATPGPWKLDRAADGSVVSLNYHAKPTYIGAAILLGICCAASILVGIYLTSDAEIKKGMIAIFILTGLVVPGIMMTRAHDLAGKNPLLSYQPSNDTLRIAEPSLEITPASGRVSFSFEHFIKHDHYFELNLVLDGERRKFLSSLSPDPFHPLARQIREMGFRVAEQTVKL